MRFFGKLPARVCRGVFDETITAATLKASQFRAGMKVVLWEEPTEDQTQIWLRRNPRTLRSRRMSSWQRLTLGFLPEGNQE